MKYGQIKNGAFTNVVRDFDDKPDPNPTKGFDWLPYIEQADPTVDPETEKLSDFTDEITSGQIIHSRSIVTKTAQEKTEYVLGKRAFGYHTGTLTEKGVQGDQMVVLGFWVDELAEYAELLKAATGVPFQAGLQSLMDMRASVKANNPKP